MKSATQEKRARKEKVMKRQLQLLPLLLEMQRRTSWNRAQILAAQERQLRSLLQYMWDHSPFYRDLYRSYGIAAKDLAHIPLNELPFTSKELLMEHFDEVVTDERLKKHVLEQWIENHPETRETFADEFVVLHTSGSSGVLGIFVYDQRAWNTVTASL